MDVLHAIAYGAVGGFLVEIIMSSNRVLAWNLARHAALSQGSNRPSLLEYVDPWSDLAAGLTRVLLGAAAGWLFHAQVTGAYAAVVVGISAPAVFRQLGTVTPLSVVGRDPHVTVETGQTAAVAWAVPAEADVEPTQ